jgi:SAM-dependent methyltransferase
MRRGEVTAKTVASWNLMGLFEIGETGVCDAMADRNFDYKDEVCGTQHHKIDDMMTAFKIEQDWWSQQGTENPWWAVLTGEQKGNEIPVEKQLEFYASGVENLQKTLPKLQALGFMQAAKIEDSVALDFGCGLGRMSNALVSAGFKKVKCVDQAQSFLDVGQDTLTKLSGQGLAPIAKDVIDRVEFVQSGPDLLCRVQPGSVDFVHSIITLQHMKPMLQTAYIEQLCEALATGGSGFFQIPTFIKNTPEEDHCFLEKEQSTMMMHYTPRAEVEKHLQSSGCKVLSVENMDMIGGGIGESLVFFFQKEGGGDQNSGSDNVQHHDDGEHKDDEEHHDGKERDNDKQHSDDEHNHDEQQHDDGHRGDDKSHSDVKAPLNVNAVDHHDAKQNVLKMVHGSIANRFDDGPGLLQGS